MPTTVDFKKLLKDKEAYPDEFAIKLANGEEVTVGALRAFNESEHGALQKELEARSKKLKDDEAAVARAAAQVADLYAKLPEDVKEGRQSKGKSTAAGSNNANHAEYEFEDDEYLKPVAKTLKAMRDEIRAEIAEIKEKELGVLKKSIMEMGTEYMDERLEREFEALPDKPKDLTLESLLEYSRKNNIKGRAGMPNLRKAYDEVTAEQRRAKLEAEAEKRGYEKAQKELRLAALPKPNGGAGAGNVNKNLPKNLDEAIAMASQDIDLWSGKVQ